MRIVFVHSDFGDDPNTGGGPIYDRRLMNSLSSLDGVVVEPFPVFRCRARRFPIWQARVEADARARLAQLKADGALIVVSHEALFSVVDEFDSEASPDLLIVHNFMPRFSYMGRPFLSALYTTGAKAFFRRYLGRARCLLFLSDPDYAGANALMDGGLSKNSLVLAPPPRPIDVQERVSGLIHVDGSKGWRAKRLGELTEKEKSQVIERGYRIGDFGDPMCSANGLITDRFAVGYKLKLMQMIYARDVIASFADLEEDVQQVAPGYPCYCTVGSLEEALDFFDTFRSAPPEGKLSETTRLLSGYTWKYVAEQVFAFISKEGRKG
ncbi:hypothetical protein [Aliiruegeria sabulilitoris]|uniref:hypothetical protein n=1 Tax=Aliiruegeria sabulilitoris TaxID=1510458 RepID=UPI00082F3D70|nr:hypothetical protein [Aliiruegeria sabulilitoris]NDR56626.1 hypothetical protein [Pseudoruegeria sp. M32A2M]